ncbi:MAG TPA: peptide chain release factor N(5)-glutamine methyltransferase [Candidatus Limnocylindria bacterium]|jgi:release factor glutamine methyltransferase|nr:peptide chain release factor N(5)-glutamine methyltransferase [Candidatus Limnocylindria bacterium]
MTFWEGVERATKVLEQVGVEGAAAEAEWLLAHVAETTRTRLILTRHTSLTDAQCQRFESMLAARAQRIPLQHLVGQAVFLDHELKVSPAVLIPRPETEQLALRFIEEVRTIYSDRLRLLDWGTGSGCLAIAVADAFPEAYVCALDRSVEALKIARLNAQAILGNDRIAFFEGDGFQALPADGGRFDAIVSNPPYIPSGDIAALQPEVRNFDPWSALDGGDDGLDCYRQLAAQARNYLVPGGLLALEFGDGQAAELVEIFNNKGWIVESVEKDLSERDRVLIVHAPRV